MSKPNYDVPAVRKAIRLFEVLSAARNPMGLSEIARAIDANKNMTFRLLTTLQDEGWVGAVQPGPQYRMTLAPFEVASRTVGQMTLKTAAAGPMRELWDEIGESLYLGILHEDTVLYIEHLDSRQDVRIAGAIGGRYPLHCAAAGKVLLAQAGDGLLNKLVAAGLERFTENTRCDPDDLRAELASVRERGWALDNEEYGRGILCFAAPISDHAGKVVGSVGTSVTTLAYTKERLVDELGPKVLTTARLISQNMGSSGSAENEQTVRAPSWQTKTHPLCP